MLACGVDIQNMAFWHDSESPRRSSQVVPWRRHPENNVLACFWIFKRLSSNEPDPSMGMNRCRGL
eukprot:746801-Pyramimonas_sp.AAC.1